ncbi:MAG: hypothetical protein ACWGQW_03385 [bacterium]
MSKKTSKSKAGRPKLSDRVAALEAEIASLKSKQAAMLKNPNILVYHDVSASRLCGFANQGIDALKLRISYEYELMEKMFPGCAQFCFSSDVMTLDEVSTYGARGTNFEKVYTHAEAHGDNLELVVVIHDDDIDYRYTRLRNLPLLEIRIGRAGYIDELWHRAVKQLTKGGDAVE